MAVLAPKPPPPVRKRYRVGPQAGIAMTSSTCSGCASKSGLRVGGFATAPVHPKYDVQAELWYASKGWLLSGYTISLTYLEMPILGRAEFPLGPKSSVHVLAGPSMSLRIGAARLESPGLKGTLSGYRSVDYGLHGGAGVLLKLDWGTILIDARLDVGLRNVNAADESQTRGYMVTIGYAAF